MSSSQLAKSTSPAWKALAWLALGLPATLAAVFGGYAAWGLCMDTPDACAPGTLPNWWQATLLIGAGVACLLGPTLVGLILGVRARQSGNTRAWIVTAFAAVIVGLLTLFGINAIS